MFLLNLLFISLQYIIRIVLVHTRLLHVSVQKITANIRNEYLKKQTKKLLDTDYKTTTTKFRELSNNKRCTTCIIELPLSEHRYSVSTLFFFSAAAYEGRAAVRQRCT